MQHAAGYEKHSKLSLLSQNTTEKRNPLYKIKISLITLICFILTACTTVPITGRQQLNLIPDSSMLSMSLQEYDKFLDQNKLSKDQEKVNMVRGAGVRIQRAVEMYLTQNKNREGYDTKYKSA